ncbi:CapA family protein [Streptomyces sp. CNQ085]|uniref:CapA family protein n=1 Tax=Streptomyces sp. CNQ085 TaxID=2886944 RepID=UPI001F50F431|nr:CapA family protein [Streptomyces sp. CNQ085]MCI0385980.1 CapA family protein [Streptomyces sp. CNQ085]
MGGAAVTLFLCGDVMLGRGVDQILPHPGDPALREAYVRDARTYVELAEAAGGPVPRPAGFEWPWGEALAAVDEAAADVRIVNLETAVTYSDAFAPGKGIHYRVSPANLPCLSAARPDVCALANNHVLDFGRPGLEETIDALAGAGIATVGAGRDLAAARRPATVPLEGGRRVVALAFGMPSSGIPPSWSAGPGRPGVDIVNEPSPAAAAVVAERIRRAGRPGDIVVVSVHWGPNWGYEVSAEETGFAHALIDGGADIVHGHSSHHPRALEVYRGRLVLYGCGDLVNDYEGITGYERYRDDLRLLHLVRLEPDGRTAGVRMVPLQARRIRLRRASPEDAEWLRVVLDRAGRGLGSRVDRGPDGTLALRW